MAKGAKNKAKLLLTAAEKISAKTIGILLGLSLGASATGLIFMTPSNPASSVEEEFEDPSSESFRTPSSIAGRAGIVSPSYPAIKKYSYGEPSYETRQEPLLDALPDSASWGEAEGLPSFAIGGGSRLESTERAYDSSPSASESSSASSDSANSASASGGVGVGGTGGASESTLTDTSGTVTRYLQSASVPSTVYSGDTIATSHLIEMLRSDTYATDNSWADQVTVGAYSDSACSTAATGTLSAAATSLTMSAGTATFANLAYTTASAQTEENIYLKFTASTAATSLCTSAIYVSQKFAAGSGYVLFQHGGAGASGQVAASKSDIPIDSALDSQNRIVVAGVSLNAAGRHELAVWRYLPDGGIDTSFAGGNGYFTFQPGATGAAGALNTDKFDFPGGSSALVIDSQDRVIIAGTSRNAVGKYEITLWRFDEDGDLDTAFGGTGYVMFQPGGSGAAGAAAGAKYDEGRGILIDSAGRYLVAGNSQNSLGALTPVLVRFLADGSVDTSFGTAGVVALGDGTAGFGGQTNATKEDWATLIVAASDGGYVLGGGSNTSAGSYVSVVWKVTSTGSFDTSFGGGDGWMQMNEGTANALGTAFASRDDGVTDLNVNSSGKVTVMMYANTSAGKFEVTLTRLDSNGDVDTSFGTSGSTSVLAGGRTLAGTDPAKKYDVPSRLLTDSANNLIITANAWNDSWGAEPVLIRLDSNGALDTTFNGSGIYNYAQNNSASLGGASANAKKDGKIQPTIDGTTWNFLSQMPLLIDGAGRYLVPYAASVGADPAAELAIMRIKTEGTLDQ